MLIERSIKHTLAVLVFTGSQVAFVQTRGLRAEEDTSQQAIALALLRIV